MILANVVVSNGAFDGLDATSSIFDIDDIDDSSMDVRNVPDEVAHISHTIERRIRGQWCRQIRYYPRKCLIVYSKRSRECIAESKESTVHPLKIDRVGGLWFLFSFGGIGLGRWSRKRVVRLELQEEK